MAKLVVEEEKSQQDDTATTTVTITVSDLERLLAAQTSQLQAFVTQQVDALQQELRTTSTGSWAAEKTILRQQEDLRQSYQQLTADVQQQLLPILQPPEQHQKQPATSTSTSSSSSGKNQSDTTAILNRLDQLEAKLLVAANHNNTADSNRARTARLLQEGREDVLLSPVAKNSHNKNTNNTKSPVQTEGAVNDSLETDDGDDDEVASNASSAHVQEDDDVDSQAGAPTTTVHKKLPILTPNMSSVQERNQRTKSKVLQFMDNLQSWKATKQQAAGALSPTTTKPQKWLTADDISLDGSSVQNMSDDDDDDDRGGVVGSNFPPSKSPRTQQQQPPQPQQHQHHHHHFESHLKELVSHGWEDVQAKLDKLQEKQLVFQAEYNHKHHNHHNHNHKQAAAPKYSKKGGRGNKKDKQPRAANQVVYSNDTKSPSTLLVPPQPPPPPPPPLDNSNHHANTKNNRDLHVLQGLVTQGLDAVQAKLDKIHEQQLVLQVNWNKQIQKQTKQSQISHDDLTRRMNERMDNVEQMVESTIHDRTQTILGKLEKMKPGGATKDGSDPHGSSMRSIASKKSVLSGNMTGFQQALDALKDDLMQALQQQPSRGRGSPTDQEEKDDASEVSGDVSDDEDVGGGKSRPFDIHTRIDGLEQHLKSALSILHQQSGKDIRLIKLEKVILERVNNLDSSVQFKLDEIFQTVVVKGGGKDQLDQGPLVDALDRHMEHLEAVILEQLEASIPDYGAAKSLILENLEEMKQVVSEVAISEVELLKTQLGVAEEAEQEALHAIVYLKDQLEETKRDDTFGKLMGATERYSTKSSQFSRKMSLGAQCNLSYGMLDDTAAGGSHSRLAIGVPKGGKGLSGAAKKLDEWKREFVTMEDKSADLRSAYNQLRAQRQALVAGQSSTMAGKSNPKNHCMESNEESKGDLLMVSEQDQSWGHIMYGQEHDDDDNHGSGSMNYE